jgi:hypothetical protein
LSQFPPIAKPENKIKAKTQPKNSTASKVKTKKAPEFLKNLDLSGGQSQPSLKEFFGQYEHKTNYERNLIFTYYLAERIGTQAITLDHLLTCYRTIGVKIPKALEQSARDTASDKGWLDIEDLEDIKITIAGINHFEHELPKIAS